MREIRMLRATWRGLETWYGQAACRRASPRPYLWEPGAGDRLRRPGGMGNGALAIGPKLPSPSSTLPSQIFGWIQA